MKTLKSQRFLLFVITMLMMSVHSSAQFSDPRENFSISATVEGGTNTNFKWKSTSGDKVAGGRNLNGVNVNVRSNIKLLKINKLSVSLAPFYKFSNRELRTEWGKENIAFTLPTEHHHYGGTLTTTYQTQLWGKSLTLMGMGSGNFSQYGYENASGMLGASMAVIRNSNTYLSLGVIYLLGTSVVWPVYPMFIYSHRFNDRWSVNCMETNNYLYYQHSKKIKYSVGMELDTYKMYFRPKCDGLPERAVVSQLSERFGLFADWQATPQIALNFGAGANVPFYTRLQESGYHRKYMSITDKVRPFLKMMVKYSLYGKSK